jgi:predicted metal-dependent phosphoesterase TrpH
VGRNLEANAAGPEDPPGPGWIKVDLHTHSAEDPLDVVDVTAAELAHHAIRQGFGALAITLHTAVLDDPDLREAAAADGLLLIRGAELRIEGADVVVLNISAPEAAALRTLDDLHAWREERGDSVFILLPHPFYFIGGSMGGRKARLHAEMFDAVEFCHFHAGWLDRNRPAVEFARRHGLPLVATSDAHRLRGFGRHYSWVDTGGARTVEALFAGIRAGRVRRVSPRCSPWDFADTLYDVVIGHPLRKRLSTRRVPPLSCLP